MIIRNLGRLAMNQISVIIVSVKLFCQAKFPACTRVPKQTLLLQLRVFTITISLFCHQSTQDYGSYIEHDYHIISGYKKTHDREKLAGMRTSWFEVINLWVYTHMCTLNYALIMTQHSLHTCGFFIMDWMHNHVFVGSYS